MPWSSPHGHRFTSATILANVPKQPGVYGLYSAEGWVFIGKSKNLQQSLFQCLDKKRQYFWPDEPNAYAFELCAPDQCGRSTGRAHPGILSPQKPLARASSRPNGESQLVAVSGSNSPTGARSSNRPAVS